MGRWHVPRSIATQNQSRREDVAEGRTRGLWRVAPRERYNPLVTSEVIGAVLAGGRSRRMGRDKLALDVGGKTVLERAIDALKMAELTCVVVLRDGQDPPPTTGLMAVLRDQVEDAGPLGGLHALLSWLPNEWALAVPCDQPLLNRALLRGFAAQRSDDIDAVVGRSPSGIEPLPGLYRRTCLPAVEETLASGKRSLLDLFSLIRLREVPADMLRQWDPDLLSYVNVNTPADLARARSLASSANRRHNASRGR